MEAVFFSDKSTDLKVDEEEELLPSHPRGNGNNKGNIDKLHGICCLVEAPLLNPGMIKFTIFVTFEREAGDRVFKAAVSDFPTLIFVELVIDPDKRGVSVGKEINFYNSSENPPFVLMITVNYHIFLELILVNVLIAAEMSANKVVKVIYEFKSKQFIVFSDTQIFKGGLFLCKVIVFDDIMTMNFSQDIISAVTELFLKSFHKFTLNIK